MGANRGIFEVNKKILGVLCGVNTKRIWLYKGNYLYKKQTGVLELYYAEQYLSIGQRNKIFMLYCDVKWLVSTSFWSR